MPNPLIAPQAPLSPLRPAAWTDAVHEAAKAHTAEAYPAEAVGIVEGGQYVRLENHSAAPHLDVNLSEADLLRVAKAEAFFHSHPDGVGAPSASDMLYQIQLGLPFVVMVWPVYDVFWWGDVLERAPLLGRGFRHGIHDCYSLIRDYFRERRGVELPNQPRDWAWWDDFHRLDLYRDNFKAAGFEVIDKREATQPGDTLLMAFNYTVPMHGAVVWDDELIIHHPAGQRSVDPTRLSVLVPRSRFIRHTSLALRFR
jgi:cell wall-associated NlpC family hydrolase